MLKRARERDQKEGMEKRCQTPKKSATTGGKNEFYNYIQLFLNVKLMGETVKQSYTRQRRTENRKRIKNIRTDRYSDSVLSLDKCCLSLCMGL